MDAIPFQARFPVLRRKQMEISNLIGSNSIHWNGNSKQNPPLPSIFSEIDPALRLQMSKVTELLRQFVISKSLVWVHLVSTVINNCGCTLRKTSSNHLHTSSVSPWQTNQKTVPYSHACGKPGTSMFQAPKQQHSRAVSLHINTLYSFAFSQEIEGKRQASEERLPLQRVSGAPRSPEKRENI